jgi:hypothetical protein
MKPIKCPDPEGLPIQSHTQQGGLIPPSKRHSPWTVTLPLGYGCKCSNEVGAYMQGRPPISHEMGGVSLLISRCDRH